MLFYYVLNCIKIYHIKPIKEIAIIYKKKPHQKKLMDFRKIVKKEPSNLESL